ncbi:hypothetical protein CcI6DRAFT_04426 [Frankia sp. CcI6]|uniref:hypothetical protein n=1 Tax=Frankia TaxID=1854 RepID=UPI0003CFD084|nr:MULTISPECIES: hypothetical protein [Frankia]ETA00141.1 hypothetical protein CcI6DRAFT_04426 [Frankia sp. CcI6]KDA41207.1 hypothetical protein BMG523Draft_03988 [Frankia sp. BMG5.23]KFB02950.1 hypothetical protein ALLO2DRAFT_04275 [Frankia sp. Allo2]OAA19568.1 hypothetical protein AAY23_11054 [Frankia casuarinae]
MFTMPDDPVRQSAYLVDQLIVRVREALALVAAELDDGPLAGPPGNLVPRAAASALRDLSAMIGVVTSTNSLAVLDAMWFGLLEASDGVSACRASGEDA